MNITSTVIGYPYIGAKREWKRTLEKFWKKEISEEQFESELKSLRLARLKHQQVLGIDYITVGDFTKYDRMLDLATTFNLIPSRYDVLENPSSNELYYAMARGANEVVASEMTKWFNTNYHYIVPEYEGKSLSLNSNYILDQFLEAKQELGILTKPTIIGPYTFVDLAKGYDEKTRAAFFLQLIPLYAQIVNELVLAGAEWIQFEEPSFTKALPEEEILIIEELYKQIKEETPNANILVQTYFEALTSFDRLTKLPVAGIGLDFVHGAKDNLKALQQFGFPKNKTLSLGIINGRDIWSANLAEVVSTISAVKQLSQVEDLWISSSCSLQHVPVSKDLEEKLSFELWHHLAFADEKIREIAHVTYFIKKGEW
jgi:5-methyltetrahydropteroyltriglutamate--homocysteine methyltransferase